MEESYYNIETPLSSLLEPLYLNEYRRIRPALDANGIKIVRDLCRLSMEDLIVITGRTRYDLYFLKSSLQNAGFDMSMGISRMYDLYMKERHKRHMKELYNARVKQLEDEGDEDARLVAQAELENGSLPEPEELQQSFMDAMENFYPQEEKLRMNMYELVNAIRKENNEFIARNQIR